MGRAKINIRERSKFLSVMCGFLLILSSAGLWLNIYGVNYSVNDCEVAAKTQTVQPNGHLESRIYTVNCGIFVVHNSVLSFALDSTNVYNHMIEGKKYDFVVTGKQNMNSLPNIVAVK